MAGADCIAVGMGCGVSDGVYDILCFLLREYRGVLLIDADGINSLAAYGVQVLENAACKVILTPIPRNFPACPTAIFPRFSKTESPSRRPLQKSMAVRYC